MARKKVDILMIVFNNFLNDSRVLKESTSLANQGHKVVIIARWKKGLELEEQIHENIQVRRVGKFAVSLLVFFSEILNLFRKKKAIPKESDKQASAKKIAKPKRVEVSNLRFLITKFKHLVSYQLFYWAVYKYVYTKLKGIKVVHAHDLNTLIPASRIKFWYSTKLVYDSHELFIERNKPIISKEWYKSFISRIENRKVKKCNKVITVSNSIAEYLSNKYQITKPEIIVNAPPYYELNEELDIWIHDKFSIPHSEKIVVYCGALTFNRGLENLIRSFSHINQAKLIFVGGGQEAYIQYLNDIVKENKLTQKVFFNGFVDSNMVSPTIKHAFLGVAPIENVCLSYYYCAPNKVFEYIQAGIPVITSNFPDMEKIVKENGIGESFDPENPKEIAQKINKLIEDKALYEQYQMNIKSIKPQFHWGVEEKKLLKLYNSIL